MRRTFPPCLLSLLVVACTSTDKDDPSPKSDEEQAEELARQICQSLNETCPKYAEDLMQVSASEGKSCEELWLRGDEPDGGIQDLGFLRCSAEAKSCDEFGDCKDMY